MTVNSLIESAKFLSNESSESEKFTKRILLDNSLNKKSGEPRENKTKIVILKLFDINEGQIVIDYLLEGNVLFVILAFLISMKMVYQQNLIFFWVGFMG